MWTIALSLVLPAAIFAAPVGLDPEQRLALAVLILAVIGWTLTGLDNVLVALLAALFLVITGVGEEETFFRALGNDVVWLLIASFIFAAVLRESGLATRLIEMALPRLRTVRSLFYGLASMIAATALLIPSTTARGTMLLPIFLALSARLADARVSKALALMIISVVLTSAGATLIGTGGNVLAAAYLEEVTGRTVGYARWLVLGFPVGVATTLGATAVILHLFLDRSARGRRIALAAPEQAADQPWTHAQLYLAFLTLATVSLWLAAPFHGLSAATVALAAAIAATLPNIGPLTLAQALKRIEWKLLLFMAAAIFIGDTLLKQGVGEWLARQGLEAFTEGGAPMAILGVTVLSLLSHLVIVSRTARIAILVPTVALPFATLGADPALLIVIAALAAGYTQTLMVSAKSVALYGQLEQAGSSQADLLKLSVALFPLMVAVLLAFAFLYWPIAGLSRATG